MNNDNVGVWLFGCVIEWNGSKGKLQAEDGKVHDIDIKSVRGISWNRERQPVFRMGSPAFPRIQVKDEVAFQLEGKLPLVWNLRRYYDPLVPKTTRLVAPAKKFSVSEKYAESLIRQATGQKYEGIARTQDLPPPKRRNFMNSAPRVGI